jgi:hypothetical protein
MCHLDKYVTPKVFKFSGPSNDSQRHGRGNYLLRGRLHDAFSMCVFMSDKPFVAEASPPMSHAFASKGLSDIETHIENAP